LKKVFIITNSLLSGGAEKQSVILTHALRKDYSSLLIVYFGEKIDNNLEALANRNSLKTIFLSGGHINKLRLLYFLFKREQPYAVISFLFTGNFINGFLGKICKVPVRIGGIRSDNITGWKFRIQKSIHQFLLSHTVFNNYAGYNRFLEKGFLKHKSYVIPNGIEIPVNKINTKNKSQEKFNVLTVGRFVPEKDYPTLLKVVNSLKEEFIKEGVSRKIVLTIVGYGKLEKYLRQTIATMGLNQEVELLIEPNDVSFYYRNADVYLSTSIQEGVSNSILEAMSFCLPIIATKVGDNEIIIQHQVSGFLKPKNDVKGLVECLIFLAKNPDLSSEMGDNGYSFVKQNYSIDRMRIKFQNLIRN
jgi:glycosyltransferase involved in cell wall biosynthesis